jgi:hypothetical protein
MRRFVFVLVIAAAFFSGCKKSQPGSSAASSADPLETHLRHLAGSNATNCGRIAPRTEVKSATDCAVQANEAKRPFYVAYEMPGGDTGQITVALAGAPDGKLYTVEYNTKGWSDSDGAQLSDDKRMMTSPCPAPLRVAQSGRATCYPPPAMGGQGNPHGGMSMPPHGGSMASPHGDMPMPPPGTPNPHGRPGGTPQLKGSVSN